MRQKYQVVLSEAERKQLLTLVRKGKSSALRLTRARILLQADDSPQGLSWSDAQIHQALGAAISTIERTRLHYVREGLDAALSGRASSRQYERILDGEAEAHLIALTCGEPPEGHARWTLRLLAQRMVELEHCDALSYETVRRTLKKNALKPWLKKMWVIPPEQNAAFVYRMEDVLSVYQRPYDPAYPVVCMDEISKQLLDDVRLPLRCAPGRTACYDAEYRRQGVANLFLFSEPLIGQRQVKVTAQRCQRDWAEALREVMDTTYRNAERVVLVMDNLNTHSPASFYATFPPEEAKRLTDRLEIHYTPKHGSWLNMAEIELSILQRQCLDRRLADTERFTREATAWATRRNRDATQIRWQFTTQDARIKLRQLYPSPQP